jgi:hypothetical protein
MVISYASMYIPQGFEPELLHAFFVKLMQAAEDVQREARPVMGFSSLAMIRTRFRVGAKTSLDRRRRVASVRTSRPD